MHEAMYEKIMSEKLYTRVCVYAYEVHRFESFQSKHPHYCALLK